MKKKIFHLIFFAIILVISIGAVKNPFAIEYMNNLESETVFKQSTLYKEINERAKEYEEPPIDARLDRVWKAVPGYNGLVVDVKASYDKMKELEQFDEKKLVFKEVQPQITLDKLEPAPIFRGNEQKSSVAFLINVAWGNEYLPDILKTLKKHQIKSIFFLDGSWVKNNPSLAMMLLEEGHEIGNHAYSHPNMSQLSIARMDEEIIKTNDVIEATLDVKPKWFAPPSGDFNQVVVERAENQNMKTILWTVDTIDWREPYYVDMVEKVLSKVHNGATILMHPTEPTAKGLESLIVGIKEKGYEIDTLTELMSEKR